MSAHRWGAAGPSLEAAPLIIAFSDFPGLRVHFGRWYVVAFPTCGCDACDETAESETERLGSLVDNMTAGRFREAIRVRADGTGKSRSFGPPAAAVQKSYVSIRLERGSYWTKVIGPRTSGCRGPDATETRTQSDRQLQYSTHSPIRVAP